MFYGAVSSRKLRRQVRVFAFLAGALWLLAPQNAARAALEEEAIPQDQQFQTGFGFIGYSPFPITKKPPSLKGEQPGIAIFGPSRQITLILFQSEKGSRPDSLILDANNNRDLTDDPVLAFPAPGASAEVEIATSAGRKTRVRIQAEEGRFPIFPTRWYRGQVDAGGKKVMVALIDGDLNGLAIGTGPFAGDFLVTDRDGDGRLDKESGPGGEGALRLRSRVLLEKEVWDLSLDAQTPDLTLKRYEGPCGSLVLDLPVLSAWKDGAVDVELTERLRQDVFSAHLSKEYAIPRLPVGSYVCKIQIMPLKEGKSVGSIQCGTSQAGGVLIEEGKTRTLTIPAPKTIEVTVRQSERQLGIGKVLRAGESMEYTDLMPAVPEGSGAERSAPTVRIFAAQEKPLAEGAMQYG